MAAFIACDRRIKARPSLDVFYPDDLTLDPSLP